MAVQFLKYLFLFSLFCFFLQQALPFVLGATSSYEFSANDFYVDILRSILAGGLISLVLTSRNRVLRSYKS